MSAADVKAGEQQWLKSFNAGDASGVAHVYAEGARLMPPGADILEGRDAIEGFAKEFVATGAQLSFDLLTVHETPELAVAVGRYTMQIPVEGGAPQSDEGKYIEVWAKQGDGSWLIVDDIFNSSIPAPA
ncbi:MAG: hypothetical protein QOI20_3022 [Acidimicrobiaceae bacterium]|jgi:uncharacterized protein (TIGR02246 family)|nr:hypothetical protein [Acidimicrobiaceae bacterium]